jgi:hypothetical protein
MVPNNWSNNVDVSDRITTILIRTRALDSARSFVCWFNHTTKLYIQPRFAYESPTKGMVYHF